MKTNNYVFWSDKITIIIIVFKIKAKTKNTQCLNPKHIKIKTIKANNPLNKRLKGTPLDLHWDYKLLLYIFSFRSGVFLS